MRTTQRSSGFYEYYKIDNDDDQSQSNESEEQSAGTVVGLNSLWGVIGHIADKTGWTWDYILHGVSWINLRLMLADMPKYKNIVRNDVIEEATDDDIDEFVGQ